MSTITLYGIPNCDTVKKARAWLNERGVDAEFHDYKKQGVPEAALRGWVKALGWEALLNRKGTTWRKLDPAAQAQAADEAGAIRLMLAQPSVRTQWSSAAGTPDFLKSWNSYATPCSSSQARAFLTVAQFGMP